MHRNTLPRLHPLTGAPIVPLGYRKDGRAIWPIMGGSEPAGEPAPAGDPAPPAPAGDPSGQPPASPEPGQWDGKVESLHPDVQKMIRDLRQENGQRRTALTAAEQQQREVVRAFAKAAGIPLPDDQQAPDPAQLTQQLTAAQQAQRQTAVELAVYRTAAKHTADADALLDSRSFLKAVENLDPAADDFAAQVDAAIKTAVDANPKLKAGRAPGASGADHTGGSGEAPRPFRTPTSMHDAVALSYGTS